MRKRPTRKIKKNGKKRSLCKKKKCSKTCKCRQIRGKKKTKARRRRRRYKGGGMLLPNKPVGYPFEGGVVDTWPGVNAAKGISSRGMTFSNYYPLSPNGSAVGGIDPYWGTANQNGGKRDTLLPQNLVNFGRGIVAEPTKMVNAWKGEPLPVSVNPSPTYQPIDTDVKVITPELPDIFAIHKTAGDAAASL